MENQERFETALRLFGEFLREAAKVNPLQDWHVVFSGGTVARVKAEHLTDQFSGFDGEYVANYPSARLNSDDELADAIAENIKVWAEQENQLSGAAGDALRAGYKLLIGDGYPYPGGEGSDRIPIQISPDTIYNQRGKLWYIIWPHRSQHIANIALFDDPMIALVASGEYRRIDVMFPRATMVISPDLVATRLKQ